MNEQMNEQDLADLRKAGKITAQAREYGKSLVKVGISLKEVCDKIESKIAELGGKPAFPAQISLNDIAAHFCPAPDDEVSFQEGDLAKIDVGVHVNGWVGDSAVTVDLGDHEPLVKASKEALSNAIDIIQPGITLAEIGRVIHATIKEYGFTPIMNLSGHGVGRFVIHGSPTIPNYDNGEKIKLEKGQIIAIEPFATNGAGLIYETNNAEIFNLVGRKAVRSAFTRDILKEIEKYNGLPFTTRWLTKRFSMPKVNFALREIDRLGILRKYPPLQDKGRGMVSQAEHTILVDEEPEILTKI